MGVSILSVIEIIYYSTLRLACNLNRNRVTKKVTRIQQIAEVRESRIVVEPEPSDSRKY